MITITSRIKKYSFYVLIIFGLITPIFAQNMVEAADVFSGAKKEACEGARLQDSTADCSSGPRDVSKTIDALIDLISVIVGIISVIVLIIGGIRYITSGGDSNNITSARNTIIYALVGLVIVAFAQLIVKLVLTKISGS